MIAATHYTYWENAGIVLMVIIGIGLFIFSVFAALMLAYHFNDWLSHRRDLSKRHAEAEVVLAGIDRIIETDGISNTRRAVLKIRSLLLQAGYDRTRSQPHILDREDYEA